MQMLDRTVTVGSLWVGNTWRDAINSSIETPDCGIESVSKDKYPDRLLDDSKEFSHYQMYGFGNRRKYVTRIPKSLNGYVEKRVRD